MSKPIVGTKAKVTLKKGTGPEVSLLNSKYTLSKENKVGEAHNCVDGTRRVKGRHDASGGVEGFQDMTSAATMFDTNFEDGDEVLLKLYIDDTRFYGLAAILEKLAISTGVDDLYDWKFDYKLASGEVTNPIFGA